jgi:hypothetical protein
VCRWARHRCQLRGIPHTGENLRRILKDAIFLIRFGLMTTSIFTILVIPKGILSADEISKILRLVYLPSSQYESCASLTQNGNSGQNQKSHSYNSFSKRSRYLISSLFTVSRFGGVGGEEKFYGNKFANLR